MRWLRGWWRRWMRPTRVGNGNGSALEDSRRQVEQARESAREALDDAVRRGPEVRRLAQRFRQLAEDDFADQWVRSMGGDPR